MKKILILFILMFSLLWLISCKDRTESVEDVVEKRYLRKEIHTAEAQMDVEAMDKAFKIMRSMPCNNPLSWYYQGAIHWVPDTILYNPLCPTYNTPADLKEAWDNCTHTPSGKEKIHFLVWHRLYIYHLEKIVRKLSGYKDFALPYWGYTNNFDYDKFLQEKFRDPKSSLYERCRFDSLNYGYPITGEIQRALETDKLMSYTSYEMFNSQINNAPHGAMHDYIGAGNVQTGKVFNNPITGKVSETGLMGWVPTAGFDPVFWTHHSNIDRLWQQWTNSPNGQKVTLEMLKSADWSYVFFDENGKKVTYTMEDVIKIIYKLDYDYDDVEMYEKADRPSITRTHNNVLYSKNVNIPVNDQITDAVTQLMPTSGQLGASNKVKLVLTVSFTKIPKGVYEVYVNRNKLTAVHPNMIESFAGYMSFFGADHKMPGESCEKGCCRTLNANGRPTMEFEFEVNSSNKYHIEIYKHNGIHTGDLIIENIKIKI